MYRHKDWEFNFFFFFKRHHVVLQHFPDLTLLDQMAVTFTRPCELGTRSSSTRVGELAEWELNKGALDNRKAGSLLSADEVMAQRSTWEYEWDWSIIYLFTLFYLSSSHASVLFCLSRPQSVETAEQTDGGTVYLCRWSASLTWHYLALGYTHTHIYYCCVFLLWFYLSKCSGPPTVAP